MSEASSFKVEITTQAISVLVPELLKNDAAIMQALGLIMHHIGHLQDLVDKIPGATLSRVEKMAESDERGLVLEALQRRVEEIASLIRDISRD